MSVKLIAYYLPQYHPIPENDAWWEKGFTEWTNVAKAKPLFKGHYQPRLPADLGFYDLRVPEVREQQAELAREYGVYGFCYYHYWFGNGKQLLERPFNEVLVSGKPDFPFMLCWANETWQGVWHGASKGKVLIRQQYPGRDDYIQHFKHLLSAFNDPRYIRIDGKPVFQVYRPLDIPDLSVLVDTFRECAHKAGLSGIYLLASRCPNDWDPNNYGFDGVVSSSFHGLINKSRHYVINNRNSLFGKIEHRLKSLFKTSNIDKRKKPYIVDYNRMIDVVTSWPDVPFDHYPQIVPDWDNSPRTGVKSLVLVNSTPDLWKEQLKRAIKYTERNNLEKKIVFIKSWNEWAEGNVLEPCKKRKRTFLNKTAEVLFEHNRMPQKTTKA